MAYQIQVRHCRIATVSTSKSTQCTTKDPMLPIRVQCRSSEEIHLGKNGRIWWLWWRMDLVQGKKKPQQQTKPNQNIASCEWLSETYKPFPLQVEFKIKSGLVMLKKKNYLWTLFYHLKRARKWEHVSVYQQFSKKDWTQNYFVCKGLHRNNSVSWSHYTSLLW